MRLWVLFLLLILVSSALAACDDAAKEAEAKYTNNTYSDVARLGEAYENTALCFYNEGNYEKAEYYYTLAGNAYSKAAENLTQDYSIQAGLYNAAGDDYAKAKLTLLAVEKYNKTVTLFNEHPNQVDPEKMQYALQRIHELQSKSVKMIMNTKPPKDELSIIVLLVLIILVIGFLSFLAYSRARK